MNRRSSSIAVFITGLTLCMSSNAQIASAPHVGIAAFETYQQSDVDSVNLTNGNVYVHIPLVSFPQLGNSLKLNFMIRFNAPQ